MTHSQDTAEALALEALGWLADNDELLPVFLGATGCSPDDLRERAAAPDFLGAVLDFILMDDAFVIAFCDGTGRAYTEVAAARAALPGGQQVNWT